MQDFLKEKEAAFAVEFKGATSDLGFPHAQALRSRLQSFLSSSLKEAYVLGLEAAKGLVADFDEGEAYAKLPTKPSNPPR